MDIGKYCPNCGSELPHPGGRFCAACGAEVASVELEEASSTRSDVSSTADTIKMQSVAEETGNNLPPGPPPPTPPSPNPPNGSFPWKWVLPIAAACVLLAAGAGVALASFTDLRKQTTTTSTRATTSTSTTSTTSTKSNTTTTTKTAKTQTTSTKTDSKAEIYITTMDRLIAENDRLETRIIAAADEINRVAPGGITDKMLSDIDALGMEFLGINHEADDLDTPSAFGTSTRDFKALTSYNMDRCNALYSGASAWRYGQSYTGSFAEGQSAKDSYYSLYPFFIQEYDEAKAAAHR